MEFVFILAVMFWVLCACATVCLIGWVYVLIQNYKWDKEERDREKIVNEFADKVGEIVNEK